MRRAARTDATHAAIADAFRSTPVNRKYRNRPTGGYSSAKEASRAQDLKLMQQRGMIRLLREQVEFVLIPRQDRDGKMVERSCKYCADFEYEEYVGSDPRGIHYIGWRKVVEDVKGRRTRDYIIKRKLMLQVHGIRIRET